MHLALTLVTIALATFKPIVGKYVKLILEKRFATADVKRTHS